MRNRACRQAGLGYVDMIVTVLIVAILSTVCRPQFGSFLQETRLDQAVRRVVLDLRLAQSEAIRTRTNVQVEFEPSANRYTLPALTDPIRKSGRYRVQFGTEPFRGIDLVSSDFGGASSVSFNRLGVPSSGGSVVLASRNRRVTINLNPNTGIARIALPK